MSFCCPEWSKIGYIGNIKDNSLEEIWNSEAAQLIRRKMYSNALTDICKEEVCPHLHHGRYIELDKDNNFDPFLTKLHIDEMFKGEISITAKPTRINLANWHKCNLKCVMCGPWRNIYKDNPKYHLDIKRKREEIEEGEDALLADKIYKQIQVYFPFLKVIRLTGAGEPLFRDDTKSILYDKDKPANFVIELATNGLLLTPHVWEKIKHNRFSCIDVSVDAATKHTYEKLRRGGSWKVLMDNLNFVSRLRKEEKIPKFILSFVVMRSNYHEIIPFIQMGKHLECDSIFFQRVRGDIFGRENISELNDRHALAELEEIKKEAVSLNNSNYSSTFGNL